MNAPQKRITLCPKYKIFADEYLVTGAVTKSAIKAGFHKNSAHVSGSRLLKRPDVQRYLAAQADKVTQKTESLQTRVLNELETMAFANIADLIRIDEDGRPQIDFSTATPEQLKAITAIKSKERRSYNGKGEHIATDKESAFTFSDKYRGLELLGKHLGMFKEAEQRVVLDVADRLLVARQRLLRLGNGEAE